MLTTGNQSESDADAPKGVSAFLALGGNLGDRDAVFRSALRRLCENGFAIEAVSSFYETAPVGCAAGGRAPRRLCWDFAGSWKWKRGAPPITRTGTPGLWIWT